MMVALFLSLVPSGLASEELSDTAEVITKLQPKLKGAKARSMAKAFESAGARYGIDWRILVAIAYHESSLRTGAFNAKTKDYGLMQINERNILIYHLSREKLLRDPAYSIEFACKLLKDNKKRYSAKYSYWVGIYRSGTALTKIKIADSAKSYDKMVRDTARELGYDEFGYAVNE